MTVDRPDGVVVTRNVWKIFGERADEAMAACRREDLSKAEVLERFEAVVGVRDVSVSVEEGEIFCIMGLSGSGKSTLVRHVNRLIEPTAGEILVNGMDVGSLDLEALRALRADRIGMVFQNMALLPHRTVRDNVAFALELRNVDAFTRAKVANETIELVGLEGYGDRMRSELSGGMQQRVGLARAMAANPDILLMDEPFSALDPLIRRNLQDEFLELSKSMKKTTLFITHDLDEAIRAPTPRRGRGAARMTRRVDGTQTRPPRRKAPVARLYPARRHDLRLRATRRTRMTHHEKQRPATRCGARAGLTRKDHRFSSRGRGDAAVTRRTDRKSACALLKA